MKVQEAKGVCRDHDVWFSYGGPGENIDIDKYIFTPKIYLGSNVNDLKKLPKTLER